MTASSSRLRIRVAFVLVASASTALGVMGGCGLDVIGALSFDDTGDATENVGARLPEAGADAATSDATFTLDAESLDGGNSGDAMGATVKCADVCPAKGGACDASTNTCVFDCAANGSCATGAVCPDGVPCHVSCTGDDSCLGTVDCKDASACDITCGKHACGAVQCAGKSCRVRCNGMDSCADSGVECNATDSCDIGCTGGGMKTCRAPVECRSAACAVECGTDACKGGVTANAMDASIFCGEDACGPGATCYAQYCQLACKKGSCANVMCCDAGAGGTCLVDAGGGNSCP